MQNSMKASGSVMITADNRELRSRTAKELSLLGAVIRPSQLEVGDYILSDSVCVERKTTADFLESITDGRMFSQLGNLASSFANPVLIIEGCLEELYSSRAIHQNAIRGCLASIAIDFRIPILWSSDGKDTAGLLFQIAKREQDEKCGEPSIRAKRSLMTPAQRQEFLVAGLPGVNAKISKRLLGHFGSPSEVFSSSEETLRDVQGIGREMSRRIREILDAEYGG